MVAKEKDYDSFWANCEYPRIGVTNKGRIIRFTAYGRGSIIDCVPPCKGILGYFSNRWVMSYMRPYEKVVEW